MNIENIRFKKYILTEDKEVQERQGVIVRNINTAMLHMHSTDEQWNLLKDPIHQTCLEILPERRQTAKMKLMTEDSYISGTN